MDGLKNRDLALLSGGGPTFDEMLIVGRPNIGERDRFLRRIEDCLDRGGLTNNGPYLQEFEQKVAELLGVKHCVGVCNATVGLQIATRAAGLYGEVIVPSFTFIATAHALQWQGITPVFCDVSPATYTLDPLRVEEMITPRTTGIMGVHLWGRPCDVQALAEIAEARNLRLVFDAAHAFACSHEGHMVGGFGDAEVFSFHATKFFNTIEGGAITTNDDELADRARQMRNFGLAGYDPAGSIGTNGKMSEISAAMGLTSLESMSGFVCVNRRNYERYRDELKDVPGVHLMEYDEAEENNYQYVVLEIDEAAAGMSRDRLMEILWAENVIARRYYYPGCHRVEPYRSYFPHAGQILPVTEELAERTLVLPTGMAITPEQVADVCEVIRFSVCQSEAISQLLAQRKHALNVS
jgi:dTDP-4-amino-4,6-dideoxygalactose transaminase